MNELCPNLTGRRHNELETKLELVELTAIEAAYQNATAGFLKLVPKASQTYELLKYICGKDGFALKYASKKLITPELCEISVSQNGIALEYVPDKIIKSQPSQWYEKLCNLAVESNGYAIKYINNNYITKKIVEKALLVGRYPVRKTIDGVNYPISFVPYSFLTEELLKKVIARVPLCLNDIPKEKITKNLSMLAVKNNGLAIKAVPTEFINEEIVSAAILNDVMSIQYIPTKFLSHKLCIDCFERNPAVLGYIPIKYISKDMCLKAIKRDCFFIEKTYSRYTPWFSENKNKWSVNFSDIPHKIRNDKDIIQAIIDKNKENILALIEWNEQYPYKRDKRNEYIMPLYKRIENKLKAEYIKNEKFAENAKEDVSAYIFEAVKDNITFPNADKPELNTSTSIITRNVQCYDLSYDYGNDNLKIYYISDIHIEHQIADFIDKNKNEEKGGLTQYLLDFIKEKISEMLSEIQDHNNSILLIGGDVACSTTISSFFYNELRTQWKGGPIISVLGNHELWDGSTQKDWKNPDYRSRSIEDIVYDYKNCINKKRMDDGLPNCFLLENELYIRYKNKFNRIISENDILTSSIEDLTELLSKCTFIVLGGIGYSGLNPVFNQKKGIYRKAICSKGEEIKRTEAFKRVYSKVLLCAAERRVIVLTHNPVCDWTDEICNPNWIYVNGHTHQNSLFVAQNEATILSDNQIGYKPTKWKLNCFAIDISYYDPFEYYMDGVYEITSDEYKDFNRSRGIYCNGCSYAGKLYMIKKGKIYMFTLKTPKSLCMMVGGQRKKLSVNDVYYYYNNLQRYCDSINQIISPYREIMQRLSDEVRRIGGTGRIHGCIVDISFFSHIYINPFDLKITPYWALDISARMPFRTVQELIKKQEPELVRKYIEEKRKNSILLLSKGVDDIEKKTEFTPIPEWILGTEIYRPSRIMRSYQYIWDKNVVRIWNDDVLKNKKDKLLPP